MKSHLPTRSAARELARPPGPAPQATAARRPLADSQTQLEQAAARGHRQRDLMVEAGTDGPASGQAVGMPQALRARLERLSGVALDDVQVHYDSPRPAQLRAGAFAQGADIHLGPGREGHLAHEAWHVVQQKQGRVPVTQYVHGLAVNLDSHLEQEAEAFGTADPVSSATTSRPDHAVGAVASPTPPLFPVIQGYKIGNEKEKDFDNDLDLQSKFAEKRKGERKAEVKALGKRAGPETAQRLLPSQVKAQVEAEGKAASGSGTTAAARPVQVGVPFRSDSFGTSHFDYDRVGVEAINKLPQMTSGAVEPKTLPGNSAKLQSTVAEISAIQQERAAATDPQVRAEKMGAMKSKGEPVAKQAAEDRRSAGAGELADVDMLFLPGAPVRNDTQVAANRPLAGQNSSVPQAGAVDALSQGSASSGPTGQQSQGGALGAEAKKRAAQQKKDANLNAPKKAHEKLEHETRTQHELGLVKQARNLGMPMMAVCAGSWRLLEGYGGQVETLPEAERDRHKAKDSRETWNLSHHIETKKDTLLDSMLGSPGQQQAAAAQASSSNSARNPETPGTTLPDMNSTHWAVASVDQANNLVANPKQQERRAAIAAKSKNPDAKEDLEPALDPSDVLEASAFASGSGHGGDAVQFTPKTVEAFSSKHGAPVLGAQWHPESYLPGMASDKAGNDAQKESSAQIFTYMAQAAKSYRQRRAMTAEFMSKLPGEAGASTQSAAAAAASAGTQLGGPSSSTTSGSTSKPTTMGRKKDGDSNDD